MAGTPRRQFLIAAGGLLVAPLSLAQSARIYRVAFVLNFRPAGPSVLLETFVAAMRNLGYVLDRNLRVEVFEADRDAGNLSTVVDQAIASGPDVLIAFETVAQAIRAKTERIPIVLAGAFDPVKAGLAHSLARPGMNVTGITQLNDELPGKHMEILREIHPRLARIAQLVDERASGCKITEANTARAARSIGAAFRPFYITDRAAIQRAFDEMQSSAPDALMTCPSAVLYAFRDVLFENVLRLRIPLTSYIVHSVPRGVLFAYGANLRDIYRGLALYVDKILRGARPGDLPIEQPTVFELVVNLDTAKSMGITIPQSILLRADRVVEGGRGE